MGKHQTTQVLLRCEECGNETFIHRKKSKLKEKDHIKHLWCFVCKDRTAHKEVRK